MPLLGPALASPGFFIDRPSRLQLYLNAYQPIVPAPSAFFPFF
jgi:hypothetical protein